MASVFKRKGAKNWTISWQPTPYVRKTVSGGPDKKAAEALARKLEADAMLRRRGVIDRRLDQYAQAEARPVAEHLKEFLASLEAKGVTPKHVHLLDVRIGRVFGLAKADRIGDLTLSTAMTALGRLRDQGRAPQTLTHYVRAIKEFSRWLMRDGRTREDALIGLSKYNEHVDRRRDRRALTAEELDRLIAAAKSGPKIRGMEGPDRAVLYHLAARTGFRAAELRSLKPESFDLETNPPTVTVVAAYSKHRRTDVQPIRRDLAEALRAYLAGKPPKQPVFRMPEDTAEMMRVDLAAAGIRYKDEAGRVADFHALRHTFISMLVASGVHPKLAQDLARHSDINLTMSRYAHTMVADRGRALETLPALAGQGGTETAVRPEGDAATKTAGSTARNTAGTAVPMTANPTATDAPEGAPDDITGHEEEGGGGSIRTAERGRKRSKSHELAQRDIGAPGWIRTSGLRFRNTRVGS